MVSAFAKRRWTTGISNETAADWRQTGAFIRAKPAQLSALLEQYVEAAEKASDPIRRFTLKADSHFDGINPRAPDWETVLTSVRSLLRNP
jgi:hypothetical protein